MTRTLLLAAAFAAGLAGVASAQQSTIAVTDAWARATPQGAKSGAAYVTVANQGTAPDKLIGASTPIAAEAQLHTMSTEDGVMKMRPVSAIDVRPGAAVTLKPGGFHVMLTGLKQPLAEGQSFPLTLTFEKAGAVETTVKIAKAGAMTGMDMSHGSTDMKVMPGMNMK
jgi:periplasmic copper chaperone A